MLLSLSIHHEGTDIYQDDCTRLSMAIQYIFTLFLNRIYIVFAVEPVDMWITLLCPCLWLLLPYLDATTGVSIYRFKKTQLVENICLPWKSFPQVFNKTMFGSF
jgi:hypothetical protein